MTEVSPKKQSTFENSFGSPEELDSYRELEGILKTSPVFPGQILANLGLFLTRASLARILFMHDLYLKILNVPGCIIELGSHWGQNVALFSTFRTIYEPQNVGRKVIAFDTFEGYAKSSTKDGQIMAAGVSSNAGAVSENFELLLDRILDCHNRLGPRSHIKKHEVVKGDVVETLPAYLAQNPETLIALIYFDLGLYDPTRKCLEIIKDRLAKGSIIGLDHLAMPDAPGDSLAVMEVLGYRNHRFVRDPRVPYQSYLVVE
jgi:hypothetical protein